MVGFVCCGRCFVRRCFVPSGDAVRRCFVRWFLFRRLKPRLEKTRSPPSRTDFILQPAKAGFVSSLAAVSTDGQKPTHKKPTQTKFNANKNHRRVISATEPRVAEGWHPAALPCR